MIITMTTSTIIKEQTQLQAQKNRAASYITLALFAALLVCLPRFFEVSSFMYFVNSLIIVLLAGRSKAKLDIMNKEQIMENAHLPDRCLQNGKTWNNVMVLVAVERHQSESIEWRWFLKVTNQLAIKSNCICAKGMATNS